MHFWIPLVALPRAGRHADLLPTVELVAAAVEFTSGELTFDSTKVALPVRDFSCSPSLSDEPEQTDEKADRSQGGS